MLCAVTGVPHMLELGVRRAMCAAHVHLRIGLLAVMGIVKFMMFFIVWNFGSMACALVGQHVNDSLRMAMDALHTGDKASCERALYVVSFLPTTYQISAIAIGTFGFLFRLVPWAWVLRAPTFYRRFTKKLDLVQDSVCGTLLSTGSSKIAQAWFPHPSEALSC